MENEKVFFKYHAGYGSFAECNASSDYKFFKNAKVMNKVLVSKLIIEIDKDIYDSYVNFYTEKINSMEIAEKAREKENNGMVKYINDYGDVREMPTDKYLELKFIKRKIGEDVRCKLVFIDEKSTEEEQREKRKAETDKKSHYVIFL